MTKKRDATVTIDRIIDRIDEIDEDTGIKTKRGGKQFCPIYLYLLSDL